MLPKENSYGFTLWEGLSFGRLLHACLGLFPPKLYWPIERPVKRIAFSEVEVNTNGSNKNQINIHTPMK